MARPCMVKFTHSTELAIAFSPFILMQSRTVGNVTLVSYATPMLPGMTCRRLGAQTRQFKKQS